MDIGKKAPHFSLKDKDGIAHSLSEMTTPNICLFFYPKDNTPGCTLEAKEFTAHLSKFKKHGCVVVGISAMRNRNASSARTTRSMSSC